MNIFTRLKAYLHFKEAIRQADERLLTSGQRHYVLPGKFCDLVVTDRQNFRGLRMKHYITNRRAKMIDVVKECFYHTSYADGHGAMDAERLAIRWDQYYLWYEKGRNEKTAFKREQRRKRRELRKKRKEARNGKHEKAA